MSQAKHNRSTLLRWVALTVVVVTVSSVPAAAGHRFDALKKATAPFHSIDVAMVAGWSDEVTGCRESPAGGMGYHYVNLDILLDTELDPLRPEALLYEPVTNKGSLRLVAVEWVIPAPLWTDANPTRSGPSRSNPTSFAIPRAASSITQVTRWCCATPACSIGQRPFYADREKVG